MKVVYRYSIHGYSGGMMLTNSVNCEWNFDQIEVGKELESPNREVKITVLDKTYNTVTINIIYRKNEKTITISPANEEQFTDNANGYGFSYTFIVKE